MMRIGNKENWTAKFIKIRWAVRSFSARRLPVESFLDNLKLLPRNHDKYLGEHITKKLFIDEIY